jgi:hypothetical protein
VPPKRKAEASNEAKSGGFSRTERLLAVLILGQQPNATQLQRIKLLRSAGLTNTEIGQLLGMSGLAVGKVFYDATKRSNPKKAAKKKKK